MVEQSRVLPIKVSCLFFSLVLALWHHRGYKLWIDTWSLFYVTLSQKVIVNLWTLILQELNFKALLNVSY